MVKYHSTLLSTTYFGPIQWYQKIFSSEKCVIEQHENFIKQTYRNRCVIPTTNGLQALSIPVSVPQGASLSKTPIREILISDHANWRHQHWRALCSAYGESPFFEYYQDDIHPFFEQSWKYLFDFNLAITEKILSLLDIEKKLHLSDSFQQISTFELDQQAGVEKPMVDFRQCIRPKSAPEDSDFIARPYYQVYQQKHGFQANMSILDLLFNMGNEAVLWLR